MSETTIKEYDSASCLDSREMIAEYLSACLECNNPDLFLVALGNLVKARGMT